MKEFKQKGFRRFTRVGGSLQQVIAEAIERKVDDPRLGFVTITHVEAAPDLRTATVFVSVLGAEDAGIKSVAALKDAASLIQREIANHMRIKWTPRLRFVSDDTPERADYITRLMRETGVTDTPPKEENEPS